MSGQFSLELECNDRLDLTALLLELQNHNWQIITRAEQPHHTINISVPAFISNTVYDDSVRASTIEELGKRQAKQQAVSIMLANRTEHIVLYAELPYKIVYMTVLSGKPKTIHDQSNIIDLSWYLRLIMPRIIAIGGSFNSFWSINTLLSAT